MIENVELSQIEKERIKSGKARKIGNPVVSAHFVEDPKINKRLKTEKEDSGWLVHYIWSTNNLPVAKETVNQYRYNGYGAYYYRGSVNKIPIYRVYVSETREKLILKEKSKKDFEKLKELQVKENDWSHLSLKYPNIIGMTDEQINNYINKQHENYGYPKENIKEYISNIKCYNKDDIMDVSVKMQTDFAELMDVKSNFVSSETVYVTSPRGGHEILSNYAYANRLGKRQIPYDFETNVEEYKHLRTKSLPYGKQIYDVNDIVFVDDVCISGEQQEKAYNELKYMIKRLDISEEEIPRLHYMAIVGNENVLDKQEKDGVYKMKPGSGYQVPWDSMVIGDIHKFTTYSDEKGWVKYNDISAVVLPYSIPDGDRHADARRLYGSVGQYRHI